MGDYNDLENIDTGADNKNCEAESSEPKKYYGVSALFLLACNFIYIIPHWEHYMMGGLQGLIMIIIMGIIMLVADLILLFVLAAVLRSVMNKSWSKWVGRIALSGLAIFFAINVYRATLPLPYLQYMIDKIPEAVLYFEENEAQFNQETQIDHIFYNDGSAGPMVNMQYIHVDSLDDYPETTGQISRTVYIHPINEQWYLLLFQGGAH